MTETRTPGYYVLQARQRANMRQVDLAAAAGIGQPQLSGIETGNRVLTVRAATCLELALGLAPRTLVRWAEDLPANLRAAATAIPG